MLAAAIWVCIKLPQEYWIHIAKLDTTDLIGAHPWIGVLAAAAVAVAVVVVRRRVVPRLPGADYGLRIAADPLPAEIDDVQKLDAWIVRHRRLIDRTFLEKVVLVGFVCVIFAQILPGEDASSARILVGTAILIAIDSLLGKWTVRRGKGAASLFKSFLWLALANAAVVLLGTTLTGGDGVRLGNTLFFVLLLTLIVTLYDRFEPVHGVRFQEVGRTRLAAVKVA